MEYVLTSHIITGVNMWSAHPSQRVRFVTSSCFLSPAICSPLLEALPSFRPSPSPSSTKSAKVVSLASI